MQTEGIGPLVVPRLHVVHRFTRDETNEGQYTYEILVSVETGEFSCGPSGRTYSTELINTAQIGRVSGLIVAAAKQDHHRDDDISSVVIR